MHLSVIFLLKRLSFAELSERNFGLVEKPIDFWLRNNRALAAKKREGVREHKPTESTIELAESEITANIWTIYIGLPSSNLEKPIDFWLRNNRALAAKK